MYLDRFVPDDSRSTFWPKLAPKMGWKPGTRIHNYHCLLWGVPFSLRSVCSESDQPYHCQSAAGSTSTPATSGEVVPAPAMTVERQRRRLRNASAPAPAPAMEKWDRRTAACRQEIGAPTLVLRLRHLGAHTDPIPGAGKHAGASCASGAAWPVREAWEPPGPRPHPHIGSSSSVRSLTGGDRMDEAASAPRATGTREPACEAGGAVRSLRATASALQAGAALQAGLAAEPKGEKPCEGETDLPRLPPLSLLRSSASISPPKTPVPPPSP